MVALHGVLAGGIFWLILVKILRPAGKSAPHLSHDEYKKLLSKAASKVIKETNERKAAASNYTDEEFFDTILNLPDYSFKLIASKMRFPNAYEQEKGMSWSIQPNHLEMVRQETEPLRAMGLIYWYNSTGGWAYINFNQQLLASRLAKRTDLIEKLKDSAKARNIQLIP